MLVQQANRNARGPARFRSGAPGRRAADRWLDSNPRAAAGQNAFVLRYQPRLSLATGAVRGAEALIRWSRRGRVAAPVPAAETGGPAADAGEQALRTVCAEAAGWPGLRVSIDVSARQLRGGALPGQVATALGASGLASERLDLEVTEAALIAGGPEALVALSTIRDSGCGVALDGFGAGYASLSMLVRLPLTALKLGRSLVRAMPADREITGVVRAVVEAAHALGLTVAAEGIETEAQRAFLAAAGCDEGQGSLLGRPLPPPGFRGRVLR